MVRRHGRHRARRARSRVSRRSGHTRLRLRQNASYGPLSDSYPASFTRVLGDSRRWRTRWRGTSRWAPRPFDLRDGRVLIGDATSRDDVQIGSKREVRLGARTEGEGEDADHATSADFGILRDVLGGCVADGDARRDDDGARRRTPTTAATRANFFFRLRRDRARGARGARRTTARLSLLEHVSLAYRCVLPVSAWFAFFRVATTPAGDW